MENIINEINYTKSYVAFLDVLGFKNLVFSKSNESKEKLEKYFHYIEKIIGYLKEIPIKGELGLGYIVISDSIILTIPHGNRKDENIERLRHLCIAVGFLQSALSMQDIWLRGGISSGNTYFDVNNNQIVGPAYIDAYLLEEKLAIYPRVILDNKIIRELNFSNSDEFIDKINNKSNGGLDFENCGKNVLYDWNNNSLLEKDIPLFIDYLSFAVSEYKERDTDKMTEKIIYNLEKNIYENTSLYKKFKWVSNYLYSIIVNSENENVKKYLDMIIRF